MDGFAVAAAALERPSIESRARPSPSPRSSRDVSGPVRFARYAFGPNSLGYCGPDAAGELFQHGTSGGDDAALRHLARGFDGAWPYLELIARANGIADPLDPRVVEAYWLGSDLLDAVTPGLLGESLRLRFRPRLGASSWRWMATAPGNGALPVHAFHVLDVFPKVGLLRTGEIDRVLQTMDSCRIRWGRVLERDGDWLVVSTPSLVMTAGRLAIGRPRPERVRAWRDGASFLDGVEVGDTISMHWDWACERLNRDQLARLRAFTNREITIANATI